MAYVGNQPYQVAFVTDTFSGNGSTTAFTMSVAPANTSSVLVAITGVLQDPSTYGVTGNTINFSTAPPSGTSNISCRYLGIPASGVTTTAYRTVTEFTATAGQTTFTPPSYTVGFINVYRNGALLGSADYTATNGTTVVLASAATSGDLVTVESFLVSSVLNAIPNTAGSVSASNLAASGTGSSSNFLRGDMAWTSATGTGSVALASLPTFTTTIGVGGATASSSGSGISFPATQSASSDANTLDDYEEGTYTPTLSFGGASTGITYDVQTGRYTKVGRLVTVSFTIRLTNKGSSSGDARVSLPFSSDQYAQPNLPGYTGFIGYTNLGTVGFIVGNNNAAGLPFNTSTAAYLTDTSFTNSSYLVMTTSYNV